MNPSANITSDHTVRDALRLLSKLERNPRLIQAHWLTLESLNPDKQDRFSVDGQPK